MKECSGVYSLRAQELSHKHLKRLYAFGLQCERQESEKGKRLKSFFGAAKLFHLLLFQKLISHRPIE
uniref:Uncharacterized protein n=1 Tax=Romanomermis culicivorax TaxID=13658 RepID=A0A915JNK5_ROMCU